MTRRAFQNETPPKFQRLLQYVGKNTLFHNRNHLPFPFGKGAVRAFIGVRPPGMILPLWEARLVSADYYALC